MPLKHAPQVRRGGCGTTGPVCQVALRQPPGGSHRPRARRPQSTPCSASLAGANSRPAAAFPLFAGHIKLDLITYTPTVPAIPEDILAKCGTSLKVSIAANCDVSPGVAAAAVDVAAAVKRHASVLLHAACCMLAGGRYSLGFRCVQVLAAQAAGCVAPPPGADADVGPAGATSTAALQVTITSLAAGGVYVNGIWSGDPTRTYPRLIPCPFEESTPVTPAAATPAARLEAVEQAIEGWIYGFDATTGAALRPTLVDAPTLSPGKVTLTRDTGGGDNDNDVLVYAITEVRLPLLLCSPQCCAVVWP